MAHQASMAWYIQYAGNILNAGGFDASFGGTNRADQTTPHVTFNGSSVTATTSGASATITLTGYTVLPTADLGNVLRIASGTNFIAGYYTIIAASGSTWTLDRVCSTGAASGLVARMGGAMGQSSGAVNNYEAFWYLSTGGYIGAPTVPCGLAAGHTVYVDSQTNDVNNGFIDYGGAVYFTFADGDATNGRIKWIGRGLNGGVGRPLFIVSTLFFVGVTGHSFTNMILFVAGSSPDDTLGVINGVANVAVESCRIVTDPGGWDGVAVRASSVRNCVIDNQGTRAAGTYPAVIPLAGGSITDNYFEGRRGTAIEVSVAGGAEIARNIINDCNRGIEVASPSAGGAVHVFENSIYGSTDDGIRVSTAAGALAAKIRRNILVSNAGVGLAFTVGTQALNDRRVIEVDENAFYGNGAARSNISAGAADLTLTGDPFTNTAGENFSLNRTAGAGLACRAVPFDMRAVNVALSDPSYRDLGAVQHLDRGANFRLT